MRIASRHMPKLQVKRLGLAAWAFFLVFGVSVAYVVAAAPAAAAVVAVVLCVGFLLANRVTKRQTKTLRALAATRQGESICEFAREFDTRAIDTWIIRAVYEQVQRQLSHAHPSFPIRASDRLKEDLFLDDDDLDLDLATEIEERTGRTLDAMATNPHLGKVTTVRDLVLFFQEQPKRGAA